MTEQQTAAEAAAEDEWERTRLLMRRPWLDDLPHDPVLSPGFVLRTYRTSDLPGLITVLSRAFGEEWDEGRVRDALVDAPDVEQIYVIEHEGRIVSTASARIMPVEYPGSGYLHWVAADPEYQGRGLGRIVSRRVLEHFRERDDLTDAVLETQTKRVPAIRTYLRLGFVPEYPEAASRRRWSDLLPGLTR